ncbi:luciferase family protein [Ameyamaea chiangmaiensis NBRC 103196]|uniref:LLM class flavin-dependent oxidoreductase n=1 Tax=Ameyamaea chiangmaiensis TaxID=442969 RepID=A0A850PGF4_9PROT|nr:LLM class flavin-dependent oxidoreductase [Ameyamaea chiangmaiensis]MBS4075539.1 LLM class flavin-dependent oxidoreductase [Ameyamaea chiangmaiensis]NVN41306.1 LLM class flavin-dependent oxidoreductase [Ameyamaea chiangmaiensis]GBQ69389.1 luciferase family protein [Ameyamaea chiangmaiensis NBRC 103196]
MTQDERQQFGVPSDGGGKDFGVFLPVANGGWILSDTTPPLHGSYAQNRAITLQAEALGLDFAMSMAKFRGYGGRTQHWDTSLDSLVLMSALAAQTRRIQLWTTFHTLLHNPAVAAKMMATLDQVSDGRAGINVVPGAYRDEFAQMGAWPETIGHDARYDLATEWVTAVRSLWGRDAVDFKGQYVTLNDCRSSPRPSRRPFIVAAGMSERGMRFSVEQTDALFIGGRDLAETVAISARARALARAAGRRLRLYAMLTLVIDDSDAAATARLSRFQAGFDREAFAGLMRSYGVLDAETGQENALTDRARSGFMTPVAAGHPQTVTRRIIEMIEAAQLDGIMLVFADYQDGLARFASSVLPALRSRWGGAPALDRTGDAMESLSYRNGVA